MATLREGILHEAPPVHELLSARVTATTALPSSGRWHRIHIKVINYSVNSLSLLTPKVDRADLDISSSSSLVNGHIAADAQPPQQEIENEKCGRAITEERVTGGRRRSSDGGWWLRVLRCGSGGRVLSVASAASTVVMASRGAAVRHGGTYGKSDRVK
ncbi:hypothetical protein NL676_008491 [Syzygium grande]|nr:hypothetical protein NL676_008491 [Syzygium grande]